jgi:argininosuccinate lyase
LRESKFKTKRMRAAVEEGFLNATEMADYLVRKGVPFRTAHSITGQIVAECLAKGETLGEQDLRTLQGHCDSFDTDLFEWLTPEASISNKRSPGSTAPAEVQIQLGRWNQTLS